MCFENFLGRLVRALGAWEPEMEAWNPSETNVFLGFSIPVRCGIPPPGATDPSRNQRFPTVLPAPHHPLEHIHLEPQNLQNPMISYGFWLPYSAQRVPKGGPGAAQAWPPEPT